MSRIYWNARDGVAELRGWERGHLGWLARGPARVAWDLDAPYSFDRVGELLDLVPTNQRGYLHTTLAQVRELTGSTASRTGLGAANLTRDLVGTTLTVMAVGGLDLEVAGVALHTGNVDLNTAVIAGSRPIQLAAKLHGYCEVHAYVAGADRAWLAEVIEEGLETGLLREGLVRRGPDGRPTTDAPESSGWRDVQRLLRASTSGPIVTSYSITDDFPNPDVADWVPAGADVDGDDGSAWDAWYALSRDERWDLGLAGLGRRPWLRLAPDTLGTPTFGPPVTVYDLRAPDRDARVLRAVATDVAELITP